VQTIDLSNNLLVTSARKFDAAEKLVSLNLSNNTLQELTQDMLDAPILALADLSNNIIRSVDLIS
jgi:Leucine-rich repeat (LRR) protein